MGLVPFLLPFVWLLELDSCGHSPTTTEVTGLMVFGKYDAEGWAVIIPMLLVMLATPFIAMRVPTVGWRVVLHVVGFVASGMVGYGALFSMFFTIFSTREARGVGWIVISLFVAAFIESIVRLVWSIQEWRAGAGR